MQIGVPAVDQVGDQDNLGTPEVAPSPEEDPGEDEQVVENKMRTHIGGRRHDRGIFMEKMVNIAELGEEEKNPMASMSVSLRILYFRRVGTYNSSEPGGSRAG